MRKQPLIAIALGKRETRDLAARKDGLAVKATGTGFFTD